jgi:hypothetical protein
MLIAFSDLVNPTSSNDGSINWPIAYQASRMARSSPIVGSQTSYRERLSGPESRQLAVEYDWTALGKRLEHGCGGGGLR